MALLHDLSDHAVTEADCGPGREVVQRTVALWPRVRQLEELRVSDLHLAAAPSDH